VKKHLLSAAAALICTFATISASSAQTATFLYNDGVGDPVSGTYTPGSSFTFSLSLAFTPGGNVANLEGVSYYFEQQNQNAPFNFAITNRDVTGSQFTLLQTQNITYPQTLQPQNASDLGASLQGTVGVGGGSYFLANITVSIAPTTAPGVYVIEDSTVVSGKKSIIADDQGHTAPVGLATYTITVVPEPASTMLLGGGGALMLGLLARRRKASAR